MRGFTRYLRRSRVFSRATEGDVIDICVVRGMFCIVSEGLCSLFMSFAGVLGATEGDFIDICVVRGMFCVVSEGFYSLFTSFAGVFKSYRRRFCRYLRRSRHVLRSE